MKFATVAAMAVLVAAPAFAQPPMPTPEERAATFDKADANKDGKLDLAEFKTTIPPEMAAQIDDTRLEAFFGRRDADADKSLTKAEYTAPMQRPGQ